MLMTVGKLVLGLAFLAALAAAAFLLLDVHLIRESAALVAVSEGPTPRNGPNINHTRLDLIDHTRLLPTPDASLPPISFGAYCCGIGHRLTRNIPVIVRGLSTRRPVIVAWRKRGPGFPWSAFFEDTPWIRGGPRAQEFYSARPPEEWSADVALPRRAPADTGTVEDRYESLHKELFDLEVGWAAVEILRGSITPLVRSYLDPLRQQTSRMGLHLCAHVRQGNNETGGDWRKKKWRHKDLVQMLNATLHAMEQYAVQRMKGRQEPTDVTVFVASDVNSARAWFASHVPVGWTVIRPVKEFPKPETGHWFNLSTKPFAALNSTEQNEAMAEAVADMFALGECDALFIPNYSSMNFVSIMLTKS